MFFDSNSDVEKKDVCRHLKISVVLKLSECLVIKKIEVTLKRVTNFESP